MAITSPDSLRTPDPGDPYNLVPDLATLAGDVQTALDNRGNAFKGTVSERGAFESTATPGMLWQDTDGIGMLWKRGTSAWVPAVWRWGGTTAQMNAFTQAPDGFVWYNTTNNSEYVRVGGAWEIIDAISRQTHTFSVPAISAGATISTAAWTFSPPFSQVPQITPINSNNRSSLLVGIVANLSTTSVIIRYRNFSAANASAGTEDWLAVGPRS